MADTWWIKTQDGEKGPVVLNVLRGLAHSGQITYSTPVKLQGSDNWVHASQVEGLFDTPPEPPPIATPAREPPPCDVIKVTAPVLAEPNENVGGGLNALTVDEGFGPFGYC